MVIDGVAAVRVSWPFRARLRTSIAATRRYAQQTMATADAATDDQNKVTPWLGRLRTAGRPARARATRVHVRETHGSSGPSGPIPASASRANQARRERDRRPA